MGDVVVVRHTLQAEQRALMEEVRWYEAKQLDGWARAHKRVDRTAGSKEGHVVAPKDDAEIAPEDALNEKDPDLGNPPDVLGAVMAGTLQGSQAAAVVANAGMEWSPAVVAHGSAPRTVLPAYPPSWQPLACPPLPSLPWQVPTPLVHQACCTVTDAVARFRAHCQP